MTGVKGRGIPDLIRNLLGFYQRSRVYARDGSCSRANRCA